jgi:hypothetical protein
MPMVYRTQQWKKMREEELKAMSSRDVRPISMVGGGRGGSLMAVTEVTRTADGR